MPSYGQRPDDVVQDTKGNALQGVTISFYDSESAAEAGGASLGTATTDNRGRWRYAAPDGELWARLPDATVWQVSGPRLGTKAEIDAEVSARQSDVGTLTTSVDAEVSARQSDVATLTTSVNNRVVKGDLVLNAKDYGALGNDSADDTSALAAAITAASATTSGGLGATVYLPPGTYRTTGITLPDNVQLRGAGQRASRLKGIGAVTTLQVGTNCVVSDLQVTGDGTAGGKGVAATAAANHWSLVDCWVTGCETGVYLTNTYINSLARVTIQSCTTGLRLTGSNVNAIYVVGGEIKGCTDGVYTDTGASTNVTFYGATIEGNSGYGVRQAGSPYGWKFRDCYFEANTAGHIYQSVQSRGMVISGCTFAGAAAFSVKLDAGLDTLVEGCTFNLVGTVGPSVQAAAAVQRTTVYRCWYTTGQEFTTANYAGTGLTLIDREVILPASTATVAGLTIPHGTAPTSPKNGDVWTTTAGMFVRINGVTKQVTLT